MKADPSTPAAGRERLRELAQAEALRVHSEATNHGWKAGNGHTYGDWRQCLHPDCVLVRSALPASVEESTEAPNCEKHGTMVPDDEHGRSWHCAACSAVFPPAASVEGREQALKAAKMLRDYADILDVLKRELDIADSLKYHRGFTIEQIRELSATFSAPPALQEVGAAPASAERERGMMNRAAFEALVKEDLAWLDGLPHSLERSHVREIVRNCVKHYYGPLVSPQGEE